MFGGIRLLNNALASSGLAKNSFWGLLSTIFQSLFLSLFFIILARTYSTTEFAHFLIATSVYQLIVAFSSMGLGQWFIREFGQQTDKAAFTSKFLKIQLGLGVSFYLLTLGISFMMYSAGQVRWLVMILATNIIFDNLIYGIRNLNIAESKQRQTAIIMFIDGFLKFLITCLLIIYPFSVIILSVFIIIVRLITVNLFLRLGSSQTLNFKGLWYSRISFPDLRNQIFSNWQFIIIGGVSIVYWRISTIMISKLLTLKDVADYEVAYKLFTIFLIIPSVISASVFPQFIKYLDLNDFSKLKMLYHKIIVAFTIFALIAYGFINSFAHIIIPFAFGDNFGGAVDCVKLMFLTFLIFPSVVLQANLIVAMHLEKKDMWFNLICLLCISVGGFTGLYFYKSLDIINYTILIAFIIFHVLQDILLVEKKMTTWANCAFLYLGIICFVMLYHFLNDRFNSIIVFGSSGIVLASSLILFLITGKVVNRQVSINL